MSYSNLTDDQLRRALDVFGSLSPENLTCDGELPGPAVRKRFAKLIAIKTDLEREVGFDLDEDQVYKEVQRRSGGKRRSPFIPF